VAVPGFDDPALASYPPAGNLYFAQDAALSAKLPPGTPIMEIGTPPGRSADIGAPSLIFGSGTATDGEGAAIVSAANSSRGHVSEVLNFHGSPAPWILIGILLAAGILHLEANAKFKGAL
jgi:hypothetical protein